MTSLEVIPEIVARQEWLDPAADRMQSLVDAAFAVTGSARTAVEATLHGDWLGHPLHPALTDVPVGAWTVAAVLDAVDGLGGSAKMRAAADAALTIGLIGALAAAVTGLTDWKGLRGSARRVGMVHGMLNSDVVSLLTLSLFLRRRGQRETGLKLAWLGYLLMLLSAQLGGHMVYRQRVGVASSGPITVEETRLPRAS